MEAKSAVPRSGEEGGMGMARGGGGGAAAGGAVIPTKIFIGGTVSNAACSQDSATSGIDVS